MVYYVAEMSVSILSLPRTIQSFYPVLINHFLLVIHKSAVKSTGIELLGLLSLDNISHTISTSNRVISNRDLFVFYFGET